MKNVRAGRLDDVVVVGFENKAGDYCRVVLRKLKGKWTCPVGCYEKTPKGSKFTAVFGLKQGWEPSKAMIKAAEKALKA